MMVVFYYFNPKKKMQRLFLSKCVALAMDSEHYCVYKNSIVVVVVPGMYTKY